VKKSKLAIIGGGIVAAIVALVLVQAKLDIVTTQPITKPADIPTSKIKIIASFYPIYEFATNVGGDKVDVSSFVPIGIEPHEWEPSTGDILKLKETQLFVYNGAGMEPFVERLISSDEYSNVKFIETANGITLIQSDDEHDNEHEETHKSTYDPHIWLDPVLAQHQVTAIEDILVEIDPENKQYYEDNANKYITKLENLDLKIKNELANCKKDTFVPFHNAYTYFANRYGLRVFPLSGVSPESEATAAELREFVDYVKENQIKVIYAEELVDPKLAQTLANEAGTQMLIFSPLEGLTNEELQNGMTYIQKMEQNLENLKVGLECQ
jgi:zinc transport system substrate-binding protein